MKEIIEFLEEYRTKIDEEYNQIKAKAYGIKIEDGYVEELRKDFFKNAGKYEAWAKFRTKIQELYESEDTNENTKNSKSK